MEVYPTPISSNTRNPTHKIHRDFFCNLIFSPLTFIKIAFIKDICHVLAFIYEKIV
ncbi:hypothetical protein bthur0005_57730 [Bacillus thuringiensis serovar pakistani str. T13001]|nr:hypothetical protein bthur0005_57730 [Bacillus thuringiensis serovar pakistani str. T13001]